MIRVIGDSHIAIFNDEPDCIVHDVGGTAFNLNNPHSSSQASTKLALMSQLKPEDLLILSWGEVDCRIHIYYQSMKQGIPISTLIERTISNYMQVLRGLSDRGIRFMVLGIPPFNGQLNVYQYPHYASGEVHKAIFSEFNIRMKAECEKAGYKYLDVYSKTVSENGFIKPEYVRDVTHLNKKAFQFVKEMLKE